MIDFDTLVETAIEILGKHDSITARKLDRLVAKKHPDAFQVDVWRAVEVAIDLAIEDENDIAREVVS